MSSESGSRQPTFATKRQEPEIICTDCAREPNSILLLVQRALKRGISPEDFALGKSDEEVYSNPLNGHFLCPECYAKNGSPVMPAYWKAP